MLNSQLVSDTTSLSRIGVAYPNELLLVAQYGASHSTGDARACFALRKKRQKVESASTSDFDLLLPTRRAYDRANHREDLDPSLCVPKDPLQEVLEATSTETVRITTSKPRSILSSSSSHPRESSRLNVFVAHQASILDEKDPRKRPRMTSTNLEARKKSLRRRRGMRRRRVVQMIRARLKEWIRIWMVSQIVKWMRRGERRSEYRRRR